MHLENLLCTTLRVLPAYTYSTTLSMPPLAFKDAGSFLASASSWAMNVQLYLDFRDPLSALSFVDDPATDCPAGPFSADYPPVILCSRWTSVVAVVLWSWSYVVPIV